MRDNKLLEGKLEQIWSEYFNDVPKSNRITIGFGRKAKKRLGSIREKKGESSKKFDTLILINSHFKNRKIPEYIIDATIAHELCHYAHGFASPLPQLSRYPHRGGAVDRELITRGLGHLVKKETDWLNANWFNYLDNLSA